MSAEVDVIQAPGLGLKSTDSLVTVRLSDPTSLTSEDTMGHSTTFSLDTEDEAITHIHEAEGVDGKPDLFNETFIRSIDNGFNSIQRASTSSGSSIQDEGSVSTIRSRSNSSGTSSSGNSTHVDWDELEKTEEQEPRLEGSDESTAFLLARLERENNALATDPKANVSKPSKRRSQIRPPSIHHLKKLVNGPARESLRYSLLSEPPPMTELEFWAALVTDYPQTAQRLPTLTSNKIRGGVPPPLRGVVWASIAGARDNLLEDQYERLCGESSPYEKLIGKDIGRSFPGVDMFRDPEGEGQKMLGKVLNCFSLYDQKIGYCQGLGFVVGPLLMHMGDSQAFCTLVRLMEHYDLRSCFLPDLSGLHLRIYQFQRLLAQHLPTLSSHLETLQVEPLYVSQWFLSFFAVTCPLPMLLRIFDVILAEGASETLMRVALSLMRRNESKILGCAEFEDVMQLLLSRELWDTYGCSADDLVNDFVSLTGLVTRDSLEALEISFKDAQKEGSSAKFGSLPDVQAAASRFIGRFWAGSHAHSKSTSLSPGLAAPSRPVSFLRRTPSKQSVASTLNSIESTESIVSTAPTEPSIMSRQVSADCTASKSEALAGPQIIRTTAIPNIDKGLHNQIEDLLRALGDMQREQTVLAAELQKEREEREEDREVMRRLVDRVRKPEVLQAIPENDQGITSELEQRSENSSLSPDQILGDVEERFKVLENRRSSILLSKHQLRDDVTRWKDQYNVEATRSLELTRRLADHELENSQLKDQLRDARSRVQAGDKEKQRLEKLVQDLKARKSLPSSEKPSELASASPPTASESRTSAAGGLRELKLGRSDAPRSSGTPVFAKRSSSLATQAILATEDHKPAAEDALLLELVNAKTAEAVAKQELEEVKGKLDSLRKMLGGSSPSPIAPCHRPSPSEPNALSSSPKGTAVPPANTPSGGFFSGWGKRAVSSSAAAIPSS